MVLSCDLDVALQGKERARSGVLMNGAALIDPRPDPRWRQEAGFRFSGGGWSFEKDFRIIRIRAFIAASFATC